MYRVTITGTKSTITFDGVGSIGQVQEGARVKAMQKAQKLGEDIRIRVTPIDAKKCELNEKRAGRSGSSIGKS